LAGGVTKLEINMKLYFKISTSCYWISMWNFHTIWSFNKIYT